ncbi:MULTISPECIES: hypothetical protein [Clostridium]|uniref:Uncharacterized protein n=1 Tax=Clostridium frigoriphilum TaxID=443253 RepID=A0ABU7UW91_9CLOT|nr:hypothetical protein [Clostridium sp. DSM 17811]MBU3102002.1 hypothetical protein [Clostridium sp. DSM 17811]
MEFIGIMAFIIAISNMGLSDKVKKLKADVKKINTSIKGETEMSKILKALEGKRCTLSVIAKGLVDCEVINVDDEWMEVKQFLKKDQSKIMIIRIEKINDVVY